jgi:nucleotide-binding universal stress UspA family protein
MYRDLLVHVDGSSADGKGCSLPLPLARRMGARLSGIHVTPPPGRPLKFKPSHIIREASEISRTLASDARVARSSSRKRPNNA